MGQVWLPLVAASNENGGPGPWHPENSLHASMQLRQQAPSCAWQTWQHQAQHCREHRGNGQFNIMWLVMIALPVGYGGLAYSGESLSSLFDVMPAH